MPRVTRFMIRTAMTWLVVGLLLLALQASPASVGAVPWLGAARPVALHLVTVGWLTQLIFGVAWWMFPRPPGGGGPQGKEALAWAQYVALNTGLVLRAVAEPLVPLHPGSAWHGLHVLGAVLQWMAGVLFVALIWPRVRGK